VVGLVGKHIKMKKKLLKILIINLIIVSALILSIPLASAELGIKSADTTLGAWDNNSPTESFKFSLYDNENNVEELVISGSEITSPFYFPINHPSIYQSNGVPIDLEFTYYDPILDEYYKIHISKGSKTPSEYSDYSGDYFLDTNREIKMLPSKIEFQLKNVFIFNFLAKDDRLKLFSKYFTGTTDSPNRIKATAGMELDPSVRNLGNIDIDTMKDTLEIELLIQIPLALKDPTYLTPEGVLSSKAKHPGEPIRKETTMKITANRDGIFFEPFYDSINPIFNNTMPENPDNQNQASGNIYSGHGLNLLQTNVYQGIASERDLKQYLIGITNFILTFVVVIAVLMLVYGGYLWIVDQGEDQLAEKSRKIIAGAVIGILIIISAYTIVNTVITLDSNPACQVGFGLDGSGLDADCFLEGAKAKNAGIGSIVGGILGGNEGTLLGGLLGGLL
jgi:hypothetical protein